MFCDVSCARCVSGVWLSLCVWDIVYLPFIVGAGNAIQDVLLITSLQDLARDESESISLFSIRESLQSVAVVISTLLVSLFTSIAMFSILVTGLGVFSIMMVVVFQLNYLRKM